MRRIVHLLGFVVFASTIIAQDPGTFRSTGDIAGALTLLADGRVLIVGGDNTLELYDPSTETFTATGVTNIWGMATLLPDGRVLLFSGQANALYDPSSGTVTATGSMIEAQTEGGWVATLLQNGKVLFTGGISGDSRCCVAIAAGPEIYDPATGMFSLTGPYADTGAPPMYSTWGLTSAPATLLADGRVLVASETKAELYDPVTNTFSLAGTMASRCYDGSPPLYITGRTATLLPSGKVFLSGGENEDCGMFGDELYDPTTGSFTVINGPGLAYQTATLIPDGTVLIAGGEVFGLGWYASNLAGLYNPSTGFVAVPNMNAGRMSHHATLLEDGRVLITGGFTRVGNTLNSALVATAEIYTPPVLVPAPALLSLSGDGQGQGAIQHAGTIRIASAADPVVPGEYLSIYLTSLADGSVIPPQVAIGGRLAEITFFGNVPGSPGLNVVNVRMPSGVAPGPAVPVRLTYLSRPSNQVTIGVALDAALQQAVTAMKIAAGTDSLNFWQWAWYWQYLSPFNGAPAGFGVVGSISPDVMERIISVGGGGPLQNVSAEQWVAYFRQVVPE